MDYIRTAGIGTVWHIYDRWLQATLCGLPVGGRSDQSEGAQPAAVCPQCLARIDAERVNAVQKAEGNETTPVRRDAQGTTGGDMGYAPAQKAPDPAADKPALDVEA